MDNFRRPKQSKKYTAIDGIITRSNPSRSGSINFDRSGKGSGGRVVTKRLDNFNRPDGFTRAAQPLVSVDKPLNELSSAPRSRTQLETAQLPVAKKRRGLLRRSKGEKRPRSARKKAVLRSLAVFGIIILLVGGFLGWKLAYNTSKVFKGSLLGLFSSTKLKGEDKGRVNILLTGTSEDDPGHSGANLTDSIMIISIDTVNKGGFIMSIPRDLWVDYGTRECSIGYKGKINAVYECGEEIGFKEGGYPDGGVGLLEKVVERDFGLDINYFVKINYSAFRDAVNAVGGVDITIQTNDPRGLYDGNISKVDGGPLKLPNGKQHLDGQTALNLARARCDTVCYGFERGDFDRTEHQRQLLLSLKDKAFSLGVLGNPAKVSSLLDAVGKNVKTDFKTDEIRRLNELAKQINNQNISSIGLADENVSLVKTGPVNGYSAVIPVAGITDFSDIQAYIKRITSNDPVVKEGATVVILNGSGVSGLATTKSKELKQKGISVKSVANAAKPRTNNVIVMLNSSKNNTKTYLEQQFKAAATTDVVNNPEAPNYDVDFVIILGSNAATSN